MFTSSVINQAALQDAATNLEQLLAKYAPEHSVASVLQRELQPLIAAAQACQITSPIDAARIPGSRTFADTDARTLPDLESAYGKFQMELEGGEPAYLKRFRERHNMPAV